MKTKTILASALLLCATCAAAEVTINVRKPSKGEDMTATIRAAVKKAASYKGKQDVVIRLQPGVYNISKTKATAKLQHISNTTGEHENREAVKHYGVYLYSMSNVTLDGNGATLLTHGEMTPLAVDSCRNVTIRNLTVDAADPSVPEITVVGRTDSTLTSLMSDRTRCRITPEGKLYWTGEGWEFTGGIAQIYNGTHTLRCESPMDRLQRAEQHGDTLVLHYRTGEVPGGAVGSVYQMRHSYRTEVATFINRSENVAMQDMNYSFLGNFGIVGQYSRNVTLDRVVCSPADGSGRTCAGFADFVQMSGCGGKVTVRDCRFAGAHDDPINVHGTHLKVTAAEGREMTVRFMHAQTYGFLPFAEGDTIALVDPTTLLVGPQAVVKEARMLNDYDVRLLLDRELPEAADMVVDNLTWHPEVEITGCTFTLTPTRGLLLTSSRKSVVRDNTFLNIPMPAILIADDARSWFESGRVTDVTISGNRFIDCASPVIVIQPEIARYAGAVHSDITITDNTFEFSHPAGRPLLIEATAVRGLTVRGNSSNCPADQTLLRDCTTTDISDLRQ